ncbi:Stk1 family PASTA domain-containing Ser/Thr kinase [Pseudoflavonifractor phocaeensis]|uniref:Stk1 family PASTA domain-containing Ser/Thr kinase n=1 Tax=Pseudoflavonifractor phocaeensis TaxID=1870988 RepID=UPI00313E4607
MDQYIGKLLDNRYEILERIGIGGMAVVYKAKCHWLNRFVAVKILKEDLAQDEEFRRRFHEESQAVAMLSHPNIVSVYDVSRSPELDYIVMELIEGITLKQYMQKRGGKLSWKESLHFITQIMKALSHAHSRGIIHRDIKPHNIMVLRDGSVKVADFGIARLVSASQNTMTQEALGSVHYISPEQARGSRIDARSDIYSAGVVLYEMLTGRLPYEGDSPVAVAIQHINSIPLSPRELEPSIPEAMEEITMKAMASDMDKRYLSADAMLADLEEFRKNPNISFEYTPADLLVGEGDEPTQVLGANTPQMVAGRPVHTERYEEPKAKKERPAPVREPAEDEDDYDSDGGGKRALVIVIALLLCAAGIGAFLWVTVFSGMTGNKTYTVPNLEGYTLEEARELPEIKENGFTVVEGKQVVSETVKAGQIASQTPAAESAVKEGNREISVDISIGNGGLSMPDVYNQDQRVATATLNGMGLQVNVEQSNSSEITKGNVMSQSPAKGERVKEGQDVTIVVSLGVDVDQVTLIPLTGMTLEKATQAVTDLGLKLGKVDPVPSAEFEAGQVCYQSIPVGTSVPADTVINLQVSTGPDTGAPTESETPAESVSPEPTAQPTAKRKDVVVPLPDDRETVYVRITVGGVEQIPSQPVDTRIRQARFTLEGTGTQQIVVYIDEVQTQSYALNFDE